jgi:hypothetical protein
MSGWRVLTACAIGWLTVGCAPSVQPGLSNAPRLGGAAASEERVSDVVSNGGDSCGRWAEQGPLRYRMPPCPSAAHPAASMWLLTSSTAPVQPPAVVVPWLQHFYTQWSCSRPSTGRDARTLAWASASTAPSACNNP